MTPDDQPLGHQEAKPASGARERFQAKRKSAATPRKASPTRSIEPGIVHYRIAQGILTGVQAKAGELGLELDVGEFPETATVTPESEDPERLVNLTAHAVARIADRFTFVRRFSRHFEGSEKRAGILSDLAAVIFTLYKRNPGTFEVFGKQVGAELAERRRQQAAAKTSSNGNQTPQTERVS